MSGKRLGDADKASRMQNKCYVARKLVGAKGVSQRLWGDLTGMHYTVIARREAGTLAIQGAAETLYDLTAALCRLGLNEQVKDALDAVNGERSEHKAILALSMLAVDSGHPGLVRSYLGGLVEPENEAVTTQAPSLDNTMRVVSVFRQDFERQAKKADPSKAERYWQLARTFANTEYELSVLKKKIEADEERELNQAEVEPGGDGDG